MNKEQFMTVMAGLKSNYPNWKLDMSDKMILSFWYDNLKDIPYDHMILGIKKLVAEEEFYPNIAKIRKACLSVTQKQGTDSTDGWGLVNKAIRRYGYSRSDEAMESLPDDVRLAVQRMGGFLELCMSENPEADRAHFYRSMDQISERVKSDGLLSEDLKQQITANQTKTSDLLKIEEVIEPRMLEIENDTDDLDYKEGSNLIEILKEKMEEGLINEEQHCKVD